jgi:hypothetical protein
MWAQLLSTLLGIWLMVSVTMLPMTPGGIQCNYIVGLLSAGTGLISLSEVTRGVRWANLLLGFCLIGYAVAFSNSALGQAANHIVVGMLLILLATYKGKIIRRHGGGWSALWK